jgi:hypothetical protein
MIQVPKPKAVPVHKDSRHRWQLQSGETFEAVLVEVYDFPYAVLFEVDQDGRRRMLTLTGLMSYEVLP